MFLRQRYKLLSLQKVRNKSALILKENMKARTLQFQEDGEVESSDEEYAQEGAKEMVEDKITVDDACAIAKLVTEIDMKQGKGVEALYHILSVIQQGGTPTEAITYCLDTLKPKKKPRGASPKGERKKK